MGVDRLHFRPLNEAEVRGGHAQAPAQEPGLMGIDAAGLKRKPHSDEASVDRAYVDQQRPLQGPDPAARPYHPAAANPQEPVSAAESPASDRGLPAEDAALEDVPTGADNQARRLGRRSRLFLPSGLLKLRSRRESMTLKVVPG